MNLHMKPDLLSKMDNSPDMSFKQNCKSDLKLKQNGGSFLTWHRIGKTALFTLTLLMALFMGTKCAWADDTTKHTCKGGYAVEDMEFEALPDCSEYDFSGSEDDVFYGFNALFIYKSHNYYLTADTTFSEIILYNTKGSVTVNICLNGHKLCMSDLESIDVYKGTTLNIYDCDGSGCITYTGNKTPYNTTGGAIYNFGTVNMYAGTISGFKANYGGAICNYSEDSTARFNMYGGTIESNTADKGGAVCNYTENAEFNMYGGTIKDNTASNEGGAVYNYGTNTEFYMKGGKIEGNKATIGGGVYNEADGALFNMTGGTISSNAASAAAGVYNGADSTFNFKGGVIESNTSAISGGGIASLGMLSLTGGKIINNRCNISNNSSDNYFGGGVFLTGTSNTIGGNIVIKDNYYGATGTDYPDDLYIYNDPNSSSPTLKLKPTITGGSMIGVHMYDRGTFITSGASASDISSFYSETDVRNEKYFVAFKVDGTEGTLYLTDELNKIYLNKSETTLTVNDTDTLSVTKTAPVINSDVDFEWKSSDTSVAKVDSNGNITAVGVGTAEVYAVHPYDTNGTKGICQVTVNRLKNSISLSSSDPVSVDYGKTPVLPTATSEYGTPVMTIKNKAGTVIDGVDKMTTSGTYTVTWTVKQTDQYEEATASVSVEVGLQKLTPVVKSVKSKVYDGTTKAEGEVVLTGAEAGDNPTFSYTLRWCDSDAGTTLVQVTGIQLGSEWTEKYKLSSDALSNVTAPGGAKITKAAVTVPTAEDDSNFIYNGTTTYIGVVVPDGAKYTATNRGGVEAGTYTSLVSLVSETNYEWADSDGKSLGNSNALKLTWSIKPQKIDKPAKDTRDFVYSGNLVEYNDIPNGDNTLYTVEGAEHVAAGSYTVTYTLNKNENEYYNYVWDDGTEAGSTDPVTYDYVIRKAQVEVPEAVKGLEYTVDEDGIAVKQTGIKIPEDATYTLRDVNTHSYTVKLSSGAIYILAGHIGADCGTYTAYATLEDTDDYEWKGLDTSDVQEITWTIKGLVVKKPAEDTTSFTYNGEEQTYTVPESVGYTVANDSNKQTKAGQHTVTIKLNKNYMWEDETYEDLKYSFYIEPIKVKLPTAVTGLTYNAKIQTGVIIPNDAPYYAVADSNRATNAGTYTANVGLDDPDNYEWDGLGTSENQKIEWKISGIKIDKPAKDTTKYTYNGSEQTYSIAKNEGYSIYNKSQTNAGDYKITVVLNENFEWSDGTTDNLSYDFSIAKLKINVPTAKTGLVYSGSEQKGISIPSGAEVEETDILTGTYRVTLSNGGKYYITGYTGTKTGTYTATVSLYDQTNCVWSDGTFKDKTIKWKISSKSSSGSTEKETETETETESKTDNSSSEKAFFLAKGKAGASSVKLTWNKCSGATGYVVYYYKCYGKGSSYKKAGTTKKLTFTVKKLDNSAVYKFYVRAYKKVNGKKKYLRTTPTVHVAMKKSIYTNASSVAVAKSSYTLKVGKTAELKPVVRMQSGSKFSIFHVALARYYTTNKKVATAKNGIITAKGKGTCKICIMANNGIRKIVKVTVE